MGKKFHIRDDGSVGKCDARFKKCPVGQSEDGAEAPHFPTPEAARAAYEESMASELEVSLSADKTTSIRDFVTKTTPSFGTRQNSTAVRLVMETVESHFTPALVHAWKEEKPNSYRWQLAHQVDDYRNGRFTEGQLANLMSNTGAVAYHSTYERLEGLVAEKVEHDHAESIRAEKVALMRSLELEDPSYEYDRRPELEVPADERRFKSIELQNSITELKFDAPVYHRLWKGLRAFDKEGEQPEQ